MRHVQVTWLDSHSWSGGWMSLPEAMAKLSDANPIVSVGYVVSEDDEYMAIVQNQDGNGNVSMLYAIPRKSIVAMTEI